MMIFTMEWMDNDGVMKWLASVSDYNRQRTAGAIRLNRDDAIRAAKEAISYEQSESGEMV